MKRIKNIPLIALAPPTFSGLKIHINPREGETLFAVVNQIREQVAPTLMKQAGLFPLKEYDVHIPTGQSTGQGFAVFLRPNTARLGDMDTNYQQLLEAFEKTLCSAPLAPDWAVKKVEYVDDIAYRETLKPLLSVMFTRFINDN